jgi:hypothetical protein
VHPFSSFRSNAPVVVACVMTTGTTSRRTAIKRARTIIVNDRACSVVAAVGLVLRRQGGDVVVTNLCEPFLSHGSKL